MHFLGGTSTNMQNMNFKQPNSLSHNTCLWLLMYGNTKNGVYLGVDTDRDL